MTSHETDTDYAFWSSPDESFTVTYSLEQFHEIDFEVNEGYRRIPHGGIEIGGLLFGRAEPGRVRIEAFRLISCEHATGPSFALSERDLQELEKQIDASASDPELAGLSLVGWFIAHTRSPLRLNDREVALFDRFFSKPNQITVLVKPERFQPTKFTFFVRKADGSLDRDGTSRAVILPLAGRSGRSASGPVASIPAPAAPPAEPAAPPSRPPFPHPIVQKAPAAQPNAEETQEANIPPLREPVRYVRQEPPPPRAAEGVPVKHPSSGEISEEASAGADTGPITSLTIIPKEEKLPPISEIKRRRGAAAPAIADEDRAYQLRLVLVLIIAAVLGCAVGYWAYRQFPAPVVPLSVHPDASGLVVTWPVDQTRQAEYAALQINDGPQQPLSSEEKTAGAARIPPTSASNNVKIELIVQHWMRDSRGIVRYVSPVPVPAS